MTDREIMQMALDAMESAIKTGNWKVDGACDPEIVLVRLRERLNEPTCPPCHGDCNQGRNCPARSQE
jgi:hypothetical protein